MRAMKDSGVEWIGHIPSDWKLSKIGAVYQERSTKVSDEDFMPLSVTKQGIVPQLETAAKTDNGENRKLICVNDFVINSRSDRRGSCGISEYDGSCSLINIVLAPRKNMDNVYYSYVFRSELFADEFYRWGNGIVDDLWSTKWSSMKRIYIPSPEVDVQRRIASFLDAKCAQIDAIIEKQQQVIDKLKAYKQSVITEAVTKGLDPTVPMKDSGVEWIGKVPKHWGIVKIKTYAKLKTGTTPTTANPECFDGDYDWFTPSDFGDALILQDASRKLNQCAVEQGLVPEFEAGSVLLVAIGATLGKTGYANRKCSSNQQITAITPAKNLLGKFLGYYFKAMTQVIRDYALYTTLPIINNQTLGTFKYALPPMHEQQSIALHLDTDCERIENYISKKLEVINKLTDYKKSLIYEAVTGKMEV